jgi:hypothetical protein
MRSKRKRRLTIASLTVAVSVVVTTNPEIRHTVEALIQLIFNW